MLEFDVNGTMKAAFICCLLILFSSCITGRIKKVAVPKQIITISEENYASKDALSHDFADQAISNTHEAETTSDEVELELEPTKTNHINDEYEDEPGQIEKVRVALETEHLAKKSLNEGISSLSLSVLSIILPFVLLASIICFILGIVHYSKANKAPYSTPKAERRLSNAKGLLIASGVIIGLFILGIIIILSIVLL